jgi:hypothetical protein
MQQRVGDERAEQSMRAQAELGRLLAGAGGYRVLASDGTPVGWLDHVRYERHADHPDEIVVRKHALVAKRRRALPFSAVAAVSLRQQKVVLRLDRHALARSPSP